VDKSERRSLEKFFCKHRRVDEWLKCGYGGTPKVLL
jgi:hypothetical protein